MKIYFDFVQSTGENFTPSTKIHEFATKHHLKTLDHYGSAILCFLSKNCRYSHYSITPIENGLEKVTIYLEDVRI